MRAPARALLVALACFAAPAAAQRKWGTPAEKDAARGKEMFAAGNCPAAIEAFSRSLDVDPNQPPLYRDRGICHEKLDEPQPAMRDYRAYLSRQTDAPDAPQIRTRLERLEAENPASTRAASTPPGQQKRPDELEDPFKFEMAEKHPKKPAESHARGGRGYLLGLTLGGRAWNSGGFGKPSFAMGVQFGWAYGQSSELGARLLYLQTGVKGSDQVASTGWGAALMHTWMLDLTSDRVWELGAGIGGGYESQISKTRNQRSWPFGFVTPRVRWNVSEEFLLDLGPEVGMGPLSSSATADSAFAIYYGGMAGVSWRFGEGRGDSAPEPRARPADE